MKHLQKGASQTNNKLILNNLILLTSIMIIISDNFKVFRDFTSYFVLLTNGESIAALSPTFSIVISSNPGVSLIIPLGLACSVPAVPNLSVTS